MDEKNRELEALEGAAKAARPVTRRTVEMAVVITVNAAVFMFMCYLLAEGHGWAGSAVGLALVFEVALLAAP